MSRETVSFIIPMRNAERFLTRALESIISQSYRDFEVICIVNDSSDGCLSICNRFAKENPNFVVINTEVPGVGNARNLGLDHATGQYIAFVDADDVIGHDFLTEITSAMGSTGADVGVCEYVTNATQLGTSASSAPDSQPSTVESGKYLDAVLTGHVPDAGAIWGKLFRSEIIDGLKFSTDLKYAEDILFLGSYLARAESVVTIAYRGYFWDRNTGGVTSINTKDNTSMLQTFEAATQLAVQMPEHSKWATRVFAFRQANYLLSRGTLDNRELRKVWTILKQNRREIFEHVSDVRCRYLILALASLSGYYPFRLMLKSARVFRRCLKSSREAVTHQRTK